VVDAHCSLAFAKFYLSKVLMTAVDVLNDRVLPFYDEHSVEIQHVLTDNGRETCGKPLSHPFELFLTLSQIEHRRTQVGSPETNGFCERFHRTVKEEFYAVTFRKKFYQSADELLRDLDAYLAFYNRERAHQGYRTRGRTPYQAFLKGIGAKRWRRKSRGADSPATGRQLSTGNYMLA
jgi:integrase-like protein